MKAIVQDRYGSAEALRFRDAPVPEIGDDEVLVEVVAAGVDRGAWHFMTGRPYLMRLLGFGLRRPTCQIPGTNFSGRIKEMGSAVTGFEVGEPVYGSGRGTFAEVCVARADHVARKPSTLSFEEASVVPYAGYVAWQAVHDHGHVRSGDRVLVVGASGAVGSFAVQLAVAAGAHVTGVCGPRGIDLVRSWGVDNVIDYITEDFSTSRSSYDLVVDVFGRAPIRRLRRTLARRGRLVIVGGEGDRWIGGIHRQAWAGILSPFVSQTLKPFVVKERAEWLEKLSDVIEAGSLRPRMGRTYSLDDAAAAMTDLESSRTQGRIAIRVGAA